MAEESNERKGRRVCAEWLENEIEELFERAVRPRLGDPAAPVTATDLAFRVAPRLNARGRLDEAMGGVHFLLAESDAEPVRWEQLLHEENETRKQIEADMKEAAMAEAGRQVAEGRRALVVWLPEGHPGVHGIVASRLTEAFGRPALCLSPRYGREDLVTGSARGVEGLHVRDALQAVHEARPGLFDPEQSTTFGGHAGAAGLTIARTAIDTFREAYEEAVTAQLLERTLQPTVWTDGELPPEQITLELQRTLAQLEPFGRGFEGPVFHGAFRVSAVKAMGDGSHLRLGLEGADGRRFPAVWFGAKEPTGPLPVEVGQTVGVAFALEDNVWQGESTLQLMVKALRPV